MWDTRKKIDVVVIYGPMSCDYMLQVGHIYVLHARVGLMSMDYQLWVLIKASMICKLGTEI